MSFFNHPEPTTVPHQHDDNDDIFDGVDDDSENDDNDGDNTCDDGDEDDDNDNYEAVFNGEWGNDDFGVPEDICLQEDVNVIPSNKRVLKSKKNHILRPNRIDGDTEDNH